MIFKKKCTSMGCKDGKIALFTGFADCKDCRGTGYIWNHIDQGTGTEIEVRSAGRIEISHSYDPIYTSLPASGIVINNCTINGSLW